MWGTSGPTNRQYVESIGVVAVLDHSQPLASALATAANTPADIHFDLILDAVGGDDIYQASQPFLSKGGRCVTSLGPL